jgi:hypothetical protein
MYSEIPQGSCLNIQGINCYTPPPGYVVDIQTKDIRHVGVYSRSDDPIEQYWERIPLPHWYKQVLREEDAYDKKKKEDDPDYYDERYEAYKAQEWDRRLNGFWFMNKGVPIYLVGSHYMYMQWWSIDIGYPKFRIPDLEYFYFLQCVIEDPFCMGMLEITKRRFGKTYRGGLFVVEYPTRTKMTVGAIQSKTGPDAKKVFSKAVVSPFKKLPRFFRPEYDMAGGMTPKSELRFQKTNVRGKKAEDNLDKEELGSLIDFGSADPLAYDGQKIHRGFEDEWAKTVECNIEDRHEVLRYCVLDDEGNIIGKLLYSSTVEKLDSDKDGVQEGAKKLWDDSDQMQRGENGRTASGLYRFFMPADHARNIDIYGYPDVEKTRKQILADRKTIEHNPRSLAKRIRKEALTIKEAFSEDADKCIFNSKNIDDRETWLTENPIYLRKLVFERDIKGRVRWRDVRPADEIYWEVTALPPDGEENKVEYDSGIKKPGRTHVGAIAVDGYSNSQGGQKFGSKMCAWIGLYFDINNPESTRKPIGRLHGRPLKKSTGTEQVMLASEFYGFKVWWEHVSDDYDDYFGLRGMRGYLGIYPLLTIEPENRAKAERHRGFPTTPYSLTTQHDMGIAYFQDYCHLIDFISVLKDARKFDPHERTKSDETVALLILIVVLHEPPPPKTIRKTPLVQIYAN